MEVCICVDVIAERMYIRTILDGNKSVLIALIAFNCSVIVFARVGTSTGAPEYKEMLLSILIVSL